MNKATILGAALVLALGGAAVTATAQTSGQPAAKAPARHPADTDGDGRISKAEQTAMSRRSFGQLDANRDGKVTAQEMTAVRDNAMRQNADRQFAAMDADKNGAISKAEFVAAVTKGAKPMQNLGGLAQLDANKDGVLTSAEFEAGPAAAFNRADANKDGFVTQQESQAAAQAARAAAKK